jgi:hypothetical protein
MVGTSGRELLHQRRLCHFGPGAVQGWRDALSWSVVSIMVNVMHADDHLLMMSASVRMIAISVEMHYTSVDNKVEPSMLSLAFMLAPEGRYIDSALLAVEISPTAHSLQAPTCTCSGLGCFSRRCECALEAAGQSVA